MMNSTRTLAMLLLAVSAPAIARGQTTINVPGDQPSIQAGIDAALAGDTVLVAPGTYLEKIDFTGKAITVESSGGAAVTTIDAFLFADPDVVSFISGETNASVLRGFTIQSGAHGIFILGASPTIDSCIVQDNIGFVGDGLMAESSSAQLLSTTFRNNNAGFGGLGSGVYFLNSSPYLSDVTFDSNGAGAAHFQDSTATLEGCQFLSNTMGNFGGAVYLEDCPSVTIDDCHFTDNGGNFGDGGAIHSKTSSVTLRDSTFTSNFANFDGRRGGAIYLASGSLDLADCSFDDNDSNQGGAIWSAGTLTVTRALFENNFAQKVDLTSNNGEGGALFVGAGSATVARSIFHGNSGSSVFGGTTGGQGGAVFGPADLVHCTVVGNTSSFTGEGGGVHGATMYNSIHWANSPAALPAGNPSVTWTDVQGGFPGVGNLNLTPEFVAPGSGDFNLEPTSPCIDAGDPASPFDPDGSTADMGALPTGEQFYAYCTAGTSSSGCQATLTASGTPSASAASGFFVEAPGFEGSRDGIVFFASNGQQAIPWGNSSSFQCVVPPVMRGALVTGTGTPGTCTGSLAYDLNARWDTKPAQNPGAGAIVQVQFWYRDPFNTSNQTTSLSDALEVTVAP